MDPFGPTPHPPEPQSNPEPALDEPPRMDASEAFAVGRAIGNGISALKRAPIPMFLAGFLMVVLDSGGSGGNSFPSGNDGGNYDDDYDSYSQLVDSVGHPFRVAVTDAIGDVFTPLAAMMQLEPDVAALAAIGIGAVLCMLVIVLAMLVARSFVKPGVIRLHSHILQTAETDAMRVIFSGSDRFVHMLLWELLSGLVLFGVLLVALVPAGIAIGVGIPNDIPAFIWAGIAFAVVIGVPLLIYVGLGISLGAHAVTLERRSPMEALKRSWLLANGNRWNIFVLYFVSGLFNLAAVIVGILLCCVGLLATMPAARAVTDFALTESFLLLTRGQEITGYWKLWELKAGGEI